MDGMAQTRPCHRHSVFCPFFQQLHLYPLFHLSQRCSDAQAVRVILDLRLFCLTLPAPLLLHLPTTMSSTAALAPGSKRQSMLVQSTPGSPEVGKEIDTSTTTTGAGTITAKNVASPGELCGFVDTLLNTLESRFDEMSEQVQYVCSHRAASLHLTRQSLTTVNEMAARIDNLETAIADLMNNGAESPTTTPTKKK
ncbi:unnamed protein product [Cutaneotrichosporon oleaginosum]